jgi:predicted lipoprotein with Yx(FWY)xxD motif
MHTSSPRRTPRRRRGTVIAMPALVAAGVATLAACSASAATPGNASGGGTYGNAAPTPSKAAAMASSGAALAVRSTSLGTILTNARGFTLYAFEADKGTTSACSGACATAWPPVTASGTAPQVGAGVTRSLVGQITRVDGTRQLTYAGHPLYAFVGDTAAGSTNGQGKTAFGARWDVLTATGHEVTMPAHPAATATQPAKHQAPAAPKPSATTGGSKSNDIPQNGGGDGDGDNSGGPSDGDGNV